MAKFVLKAEPQALEEPKGSEYEEAIGSVAQRTDYAGRMRTLERFISTIRETEASTGAMAVFKAYLKATQGAGEIGDRFPLSEENIQAFEEATTWYEELKRDWGSDHPFVEQLGDKILQAFADHYARSVRREHTNYKFLAPPDVGPRQGFFSGKKTDSLEK